MKRQLSEDELSRLSQCVTQQVGLRFPRERWPDMEREIRAAARDFQFTDVHACVEWLLASPLSRHQVEVLARHLTVGETYFFRERPAFDFFGKHILPELLRLRTNGQRVRIWSAGCASGEEPYSIAILLDQCLGKEAAHRASVLATDINPRSLTKAEEGVYGDWSFRGVSPSLKKSYFHQHGRRYKIRRKIREPVWFSYLNLAEDAYPSLPTGTNAMDVIFCRNVLMYFSPEQARKVVRNFHRSLVEGGWLLVSPCEASAALFPEFSPHLLPETIVYRKQTAPADTVGWLPRPVVQQHPPLDGGGIAGLRAAERTQALFPLDSAALPGGVHGAPQGAGASEAPAAALPDAHPAGSAEPPSEAPQASAPDAVSRVVAARTLANQGRLTEAMAQCELAVKDNKLHTGYQYLRATILLELGDYEEARLALKRTVYLDPDFVLAYLSLSNLARRRNDGAAATRYLRVARALLSTRDGEELLPESEGMTAGRLLEIVEAQLGSAANGNGRREVR